MVSDRQAIRSCNLGLGVTGCHSGSLAQCVTQISIYLTRLERE
jgi:hypothetical protein